MNFLKNIFGGRPGEEFIKDKSDLRRVKMLLSRSEYNFVINSIEKLMPDIEPVKCPSELVTPPGTFKIPLVIKKGTCYIVFLPGIRKFDQQAYRDLITTTGFIRKSLFFNSAFIIGENQDLPPSLSFYCSNDPIACFSSTLYVDIKFARKKMDPRDLLVDDFREGFKQSLRIGSDSLKLIDRYLKSRSKHISREILETEPLEILIEVLTDFLERIFVKELGATKLTSKQVKTGVRFLTFKTISLSVDFEGKLVDDLKKRGCFSLYDFFRQVKKMVENPWDLPMKDNLPFLEWRLSTEQIQHVTRSIPLIKMLKEINHKRLEDIEKYGPAVSNSWVDVYFCKHCKKLDPKFKTMEQLRFHTLKEMKSFMIHQLARTRTAATSEKCATCGRELEWHKLLFSQLQHYISDLELDLQLSYEAMPTGHFYYLWQTLNRDGVTTRLGIHLTDEGFKRHLKRYFSAAIPFVKLLKKSLRTRKSENEKLQEGYHVFALAPIEGDNPYIHDALEELLAPLKLSRHNYQSFNLTHPDKTEYNFYRDTFIKWASDFYKLFTREGYQLVSIVDVEQMKTRLIREFESMGIVTDRAGDTWHFSNGRYTLRDNIVKKIHRMIYTAQYASEFIATTVGTFVNRFEHIRDLHEQLQVKFGEQLDMELERKTGVMTLLDRETGIKAKFHLYNFATRYKSTEYSTIYDIIHNIVFTGRSDYRICKCGNPTDIFIRLSCPEKLARIQKELPAGELYRLEDSNLIYVFTINCPKHSRHITNNMIEEMGLTVQSLLGKVKEDISRDSFEIELYLVRYKNREYIAVIGEDAVTLGSESNRTRQLLSLCYHTTLSEKITLYSGDLDQLFMGEYEVSRKEMEEFAEKFTMQVKGDTPFTCPVDFFHRLYLPAEGHGIINVSHYQEIDII